MTLTQDEAQRLGHNYMGTEHLLLGLVREGEGIAAIALKEMGVSLEDSRAPRFCRSSGIATGLWLVRSA